MDDMGCDCMKCVVCKKKIQAGTCHNEVWIQINGKMVKVPTNRFTYGMPSGTLARRKDKVNEGFHTCMNHMDDPIGDRCIDKLERGEFA